MEEKREGFFEDIYFLSAGMVICLVLSALFVILIHLFISTSKSKKNISSSYVPPNKNSITFSPPAKPDEPKKISDIESCTTNAGEHPLIHELAIVNNITAGSYSGVVTSIQDDSSNKMIRIGVQADNGDETHTFTIKKDIVMFYSEQKQQFKVFTDIHIGKHIQLNFNCDPQKGNNLTIFSIGIS